MLARIRQHRRAAHARAAVIADDVRVSGQRHDLRRTEGSLAEIVPVVELAKCRIPSPVAPATVKGGGRRDRAAGKNVVGNGSEERRIEAASPGLRFFAPSRRGDLGTPPRAPRPPLADVLRSADHPSRETSRRRRVRRQARDCVRRTARSCVRGGAIGPADLQGTPRVPARDRRPMRRRPRSPQPRHPPRRRAPKRPPRRAFRRGCTPAR